MPHKWTTRDVVPTKTSSRWSEIEKSAIDLRLHLPVESHTHPAAPALPITATPGRYPSTSPSRTDMRALYTAQGVF